MTHMCLYIMFVTVSKSALSIVTARAFRVYSKSKIINKYYHTFQFQLFSQHYTTHLKICIINMYYSDQLLIVHEIVAYG